MKFLLLGVFFLMLIPSGYSQVGAWVPDFTMSQSEFEAQALRPKTEVWVVDFWASWCGPCIESIPHLKAIQQRFAAKGVRFISISWDESDSKWKAALERLRMPWQHFRVPKENAAFFDKHFPHNSIPKAYVIRMDGKIKKVSGVDVLESAIQKALKSKPN